MFERVYGCDLNAYAEAHVRLDHQSAFVCRVDDRPTRCLGQHVGVTCLGRVIQVFSAKSQVSVHDGLGCALMRRRIRSESIPNQPEVRPHSSSICFLCGLGGTHRMQCSRWRMLPTAVGHSTWSAQTLQVEVDSAMEGK